MRYFLTFVLGLLGMFLAPATWQTGAAAQDPAANGEGKIRVLIVTGGHDFDRKEFFELFDAIPDIAYEAVEQPAAMEKLKPGLEEQFDAVLFYDMWTGPVPETFYKDFAELLDRGIGLFVLHHAVGSHPTSDLYHEIIGGKYHIQAETTADGRTIPGSTYMHDLDLPIHVADQEHPITKGIQDFTIHDEGYKGCSVDPAARVLLTADHPQSGREIAWVKSYGKSRVFYLMLGHDAKAYRQKEFVELIGRGLRWTAGQLN